MSWNYAVHQINRSFEQLALWYRDFMHRTEEAIRSLHQRILYLERREALHAPSDEQVERVLRKILAERFGDGVVSNHVDLPHTFTSGDYLIDKPKEATLPTTIPIDVATLQVDPRAVPSKAYGETFRQLENGLQGYPHVDDGDMDHDGESDVKDHSLFRRTSTSVAG